MRWLASILLGAALRLAAGPALAAPAVTGFTPDHGPPGTLVKIVGAGFSSLNEVDFGGIEAESFRIVADNHVKATVPTGAVTGPITLRTASGDVQTAKSFVVEAMVASLVPRLEPPRPNPARGPVALRFALPRAARVSLAIHGADGRLLRRLVDGTLPAGLHDRAWDGNDRQGRRVRPGVYFALLAVEDYRLARRIQIRP